MAGEGELVSGLIGGVGDMFIGPVMANVQKGWSERAARKARQWAEYMRSTAYQATVEDLRKAGLNPALAYTKGETGTPGGVQASVPDIDRASLSEGFARASSTAKQMKLLNEQAALLAAQRRKAETEASVTAETAGQRAWAEIGETLSRQALYDAQMLQTSAMTKKVGEEEIATRVGRMLSQSELNRARLESEFWGSTPGKLLFGGEKVREGVDLFNPLRGLFGGRRRTSAREEENPFHWRNQR